MLLALLGVSLLLVLTLLFRNASEPTGARHAATPTGTSTKDPRLEGQGSPQSSEPHALPSDGRWVHVVVEVVDRRGRAISGGALSAARIDVPGAAPIQARPHGSLHVLRVPAEGPARWGLSYVDRAAGILSGPRVSNTFAIAGAEDSAERHLRIVAFRTGSLFVEVVDGAGNPASGVSCWTSPVSAWEQDPHRTDSLGQARISGVVGFVHVWAGPKGGPSSESRQVTVHPGQEKKVRLILPHEMPAENVPVYVDSGPNEHVSGQRVRVTVFSRAVGGAEGSTVVDGDPVMLPIDRHGPVTAIVEEATLGRMVFRWPRLTNAGSESELRLVIGMRHRVRLRFLGRDGSALPNLRISYRRRASGKPRGEDNVGLMDFHPGGSPTTAQGSPWLTDEAGEVLTTALRPGVYEVSADRQRNTWDPRFDVPGRGDVQELRVDGVSVLAGRLEGPASVAGQHVVIQARPWADLQGKRPEVALARPGDSWTATVRPDGRWAMAIHLPPGADLACAATFPSTAVPFEMRRTLDLVHVRLGRRDVLLRSDVPGTWAVARIVLRRGDITALIGYAEIRLAAREDRGGLLVPLRLGQRTTVGPLVPGTYAVYYREDADLGPRIVGGPAAGGGVRALGVIELVPGEHDYDIEIPG